MRSAEAIRFYCGLNAKTWGHHPVQPGPYACIAPLSGRRADRYDADVGKWVPGTRMVNQVSVPAGTAVILDSGAFCDRVDARLSFEEARDRQIAHAYRFRYASQIQYLATYDLLVDEKWLASGERRKSRWTLEEAEAAVKETVAAAHYLARQRRWLRCILSQRLGLILSAQGVSVEQYLRCCQQLIPLLTPGDLIGLGGWCVTGLFPHSIFPVFQQIMAEVIPFLGSQGVAGVHLWGCLYPPALAYLLALCDRSGMRLSTDSAGPITQIAMGGWGYGSWRDRTYRRPPVLESCKVRDAAGRKVPMCSPDTHCLGLEQARHVRLVREWLAVFRKREADLYQRALRPRAEFPQQLSWIDPA